MNITLEPLLSRGELYERIRAQGISMGHRQFEPLVPLLPYVLIPGQTRKRYRLSSVLVWLASLPEIQPQDDRSESLHRRRKIRKSA